MSIYKSSSLAMIPSAYKDGKLYSVRPTDGSGDFTFSRGSNLAATRVASSGYIEKGRENLLLQSNQFDTTWINYNTTETSGQSGYDGTNDAWLIEKTGASGSIYQTKSISGVNTFSVYAKKGTRDWVRLTFLGTTNAYFDLANGVVGTRNGALAIDSSITSVGGGWYRISFVSNNTSTTGVSIIPAEGDGAISGTSGNIYIQDAQVEAGLVATDYIETGASTAQAGILEDMPRLDYSGGATCPSLLLEPQRSNLVTFSEYYDASDWAKSGSPSVTTNSVVSPSGLHNASTLTSTASSDRIQLTRSAITGSATYSAYVKSNGAYTKLRLRDSGSGNDARFNVNADGTITYDTGTNTSYKIEENGNGWYRLSFTFTAAVGTSLLQLFPDFTSGGGSAYVWGVQMEEGGYPTSYIPTYGSSVTRSKDFVSLTSASDLMDVNGTTFLLEVQGISNGGDSRRFSISDGTYNNRAVIELDETADTIKVFLVGNGSVGASLTITGIDQTNNNKIAVAFDSSGVIVYINGEYKTQDTSITLPTALSEIKFRDGGGSNLEMEGYVKQAIVFSSRLTDTELASLTTL